MQVIKKRTSQFRGKYKYTFRETSFSTVVRSGDYWKLFGTNLI